MITILLISLFSAIAIVVPSWSAIHDPYGRGLSKIKPNGYVLFIAVILLIVLPVAQYNCQKAEQKKENAEREKVLKRFYDSSLLEVKKKFDSSRYTSDSIIADNLGKYGYKFDSVSDRLEKLVRDSSKTKIIVQGDPALQISIADPPGVEFLEKVNNETKIRINIISVGAGSSYFDIKYGFVLAYTTNDTIMNGRYVSNSNKNIIEKNAKLSEGVASGSYHLIPIDEKFTSLFIWLHGKYKRLDGTGNFVLDEVCWVNLNTKRVLKTMGQTREAVIKLISDNEK